MLNQVVFIGRLVRTPELRESENGKKYSFITLAVNRSYRNVDGKYDVDFIDCQLWTGIAENTAEFCKKGDLVGIKGRIESRTYMENDVKKYTTDIIVEKITFLSPKKQDIE